MKILTTLLILGTLLSADSFTLQSNTLEGQLSSNQEFNGFGCTGKNISPELHWKHPPKGTKSFALTVYDPDAPTGSGWWHWLIVNIPSDTLNIAENSSSKQTLPKGSLETVNDYGNTLFGGACPPEGDKAHRYIFTLHALDTAKLDLTQKSDSALVGYMINSHTIEKTSLMSYYKR